MHTSTTRSSPHVLVISQIYPPDLGGSATRALNVAKGLVKKGFRVTVVAGVPHYPLGSVPDGYRWKPYVVEYRDSIRTFRTFEPPMPSKGFGRRLMLIAVFLVSSMFPLLQVGKVDFVFASNPQVFAVFPGRAYGALWSAPVVLNADDMWPESLYDLGMLRSSLGRRIGDFIARTAYSFADAITPISQGYVKTLTEKYGVNPTKVDVIRGGVDMTMFENENTEHHQSFLILYIGAFSRAYDFDQVMNAARILARRPEFRVVFQGAGELAPHMKAMLRESKLENVLISDEVVSRERAAQMMMNADVLIVPLAGSRNIERGFSSKIYEYQASGRPIVCCSNGVAGEYISETKSGMVVEPGDYVSLARAFEYLRDHKSDADEMGRRGKEHVEVNHSIDSIGDGLMALLEKLTAEAR